MSQINVNNRKAAKIISDLPEYVIDYVSFHPYNLEYQEKTSVCFINNNEIYSVNGVNDARMGVSEPNQICETCKQNCVSCTGHQGVIRLNKAIINPRFLKNVIFLMKCICNCCGELLISDEMIDTVKIKGPGRLKILSELASNVCFGKNKDPRFKQCIRNPSFMVKKSKNLHFLMTEYCIKEGSEKKKIHLPMHVETIVKILKRISGRPDQLKKLGFTGITRPIDYIIQDYNVIPVCNRRPHYFVHGQPQDDPITCSYKDLVNKNEKLNIERIQDVKKHKVTEIERDLWVHAIHIMDNTDGTNKHGKSEPIKGIKERISEGKDRSLARGSQIKRNNYTGRTVAGPSHSSSIIFVEVPEKFRESHTILEKVTKFNIRKIIDLFEKRQIASIIYATGPKKDKNYVYQDSNSDKFPPPSIGDTVRRWGETGDMIMFGRNPTLSKFSNISAMVKYVNKKTIGVSCPLTKQFNMDFDGDESHLNMLQGIGARTEARTIMSVRNCIMSFKSSQPNIAIFYNCLSSGRLLSMDNFQIDDEDWENVIEKLLDIDYIPGKKRKDFKSRIESLKKRLSANNISFYSPKALFSLVFPENFKYVSNGIEIKDGIFVNGKIGSKNIGCSKRSIVHILYKNYGTQEALDFITEANFILEYFLYRRGFSLTYRDILSSDTSAVKKLIQAEKNNIQKQIMKDSSEAQIYNLLNKLSSLSDNTVSANIKEDNPLSVMSESGAKGNSRNSMQICGALGQQFMYDKLPEKNITNGKRCSPFYPAGTLDICANGFVENSFMTGLSPCEMFFHLYSSRINLIDTSVKTAETGHFSRKAHKFLEDYTTEYDGTIRGCSGKIVSFSYLDGFAVEKCIQTKYNELGDVNNFVDIDWLVDHINTKY